MKVRPTFSPQQQFLNDLALRLQTTTFKMPEGQDDSFVSLTLGKADGRIPGPDHPREPAVGVALRYCCTSPFGTLGNLERTLAVLLPANFRFDFQDNLGTDLVIEFSVQATGDTGSLFHRRYPQRIRRNTSAHELITFIVSVFEQWTHQPDVPLNFTSLGNHDRDQRQEPPAV